MLNDRIEVLPRADWEANALLPTSDQANATSAQPAAAQRAGADGLRLAHYCTLEELVGLVFGTMTVLYIVASLASLN